MKDILIHSDRLQIHVNALGAELKGVEMEGVEYLWQGETGIYPRTAPTLFPVTGRFLSDTYYVGDRAYHMQPSGIAMDRNFHCLHATDREAAFQLQADESTLRQYPFLFSLTVVYTAQANILTIAYQVENHGEDPMPFAVGSHTAYKWPLLEGETPEDYRLRFACKENLESFNPFGWRQPFVQGTDMRPLSHDLFENYTRSITNIRSSWIQLESKRHKRAVRIHREGFPFLAIWTLPDPRARMLCLEPCTSLHPGDGGCTRLEDRAGIEILQPKARWERSFFLEFL